VQSFRQPPTRHRFSHTYTPYSPRQRPIPRHPSCLQLFLHKEPTNKVWRLQSHVDLFVTRSQIRMQAYELQIIFVFSPLPRLSRLSSTVLTLPGNFGWCGHDEDNNTIMIRKIVRAIVTGRHALFNRSKTPSQVNLGCRHRLSHNLKLSLHPQLAS